MKNTVKSIIFAAAVVVFAALLLAGCRSGCDQDRNPRPEDTSLGRVIDSPAELPLTPSRGGMGTPSQRGTDSLREYYERRERWEMLHGGMSRWESDK